MNLTPGAKTAILWLALLGGGFILLGLQLKGVLSQTGALLAMVGLVAGWLVLRATSRRG